MKAGQHSNMSNALNTIGRTLFNLGGWMLAAMENAAGVNLVDVVASQQTPGVSIFEWLVRPRPIVTACVNKHWQKVFKGSSL